MRVFAHLRQMSRYLIKVRIHRKIEKQRAHRLRLEVIIFLTERLEPSATSASFCSILALAIMNEMRELMRSFCGYSSGCGSAW
jgi:hypothetical protein